MEISAYALGKIQERLIGGKSQLSRNPNYTKYHPKWYRKQIPIFWWVHKWVYARFILRELTSFAVAFYVIVLLFQIRALTQSQEAYSNFSELLKTPVSIVIHSIAFLFLLYHTITWFNLAPKALALRLGNMRVPDVAIKWLNYIAWIILSALIAWIMLTI